LKVESKQQLSCIITKGLAKYTFKFIRDFNGLWSSRCLNLTGPCNNEASWESVVQQAQNCTRVVLPRTVERVIQSNRTETSLGDTSRIIGWLREDGYCKSYYYVSASQIVIAERWALPSIFLKEWDIISPCPVMQMNKLCICVIKEMKRNIQHAMTFA